MYDLMISCKICGKASSASLWIESDELDLLSVNEHQCPVCNTLVKKVFSEPTVYKAEGYKFNGGD